MSTTSTDPAGTSAALRLARGLEDEPRIDALSAKIGAVAGAVLPDGDLLAQLRGRALGHALHPLLTDLPLGCWIGSALLDVTGPRRFAGASTRLVGLGLGFSVPTALTGLADWSRTAGGSRRVASAHAAMNAAVSVSYLASYVLRRRGHRAAGIGTAMVGGVLATWSGYLGGHLTLVLKEPVEGPTTGE